MDDRLETKFLRLLEALVRHEVEFVIVGGVAALLEGAPILTLDLDILHRQTPENIERLLRVLSEIHARYRDPAGRTILPDASRLATNRFNLLLTDLGALDILGNLGEGFGYEDLLERSHVYAIGGIRVQSLGLKTLIEMKELAGRDKDRAVLPVLRRTLEMKDR
ncbi:MAG TPA: hypothetical protein VF756_17445 [Thermoanaerobaculia bacterium]